MTDYYERKETMDRKAYLTLGLIVGMAGGAIAGLLAAPRSGEDSRRMLRARAEKARRKAREQMDTGRDKATTALQKAADKSSHLADKAQDKVMGQVKDTAEQVRSEASRRRTERELGRE